MPRPRPLLSVRLIGPADVVTAQKTHLAGHLAAVFGDTVVCRTSTHPASHANEIRVYLTVSRREVPSQ
ncbi:hypothetical protein [Actinoplanes aureus]|uniref:Uncharacterized protein n=1 Tax=Actinoplanes aureus TaxID=2792083 RepID=A0A931CI62_9ACTN|nr:hypothetical protein [Actinoplanes aureus]MBG0568087.1 hypothetical protein [Actinoplanes aureus]